jgi:exodeoxyribonuclease V beta subunit
VPIVREGAADGAAVALEPPAEVVARPTDPPDELRLRLGSGTAYGTFVHGVLEHLDFVTVSPRPSAPLLAPSDPRLVRDEVAGAFGEAPTPLRRLVSHLARASQVEAPAALELERLLPALLSTPLDSVSSDDDLFLPAGFSLNQVAAAHRQDELGFDLRLGEGTRFLRRRPPHELGPLERRPGRVSPRAVFDALALEPRHPRVAAWLDHQARRATEGRALVGNLAGVLTGSIDLLFRAPGPKGLRYYLADYKTNRIAGALPGHHDQAWMAWKMATSGYPLQSLLYTLALHRLLRQRLGGAYSYDACVGGTLYLFVRGMSGPTTPRDGGRCLGVFAHRWARATVEALDAALEAEPEGAAAECVREREERAT